MLVFPYEPCSLMNAMHALVKGRRVRSVDLPVGVFYQTDEDGNVDLYDKAVIDGRGIHIRKNLILQNIDVGWEVESALIGSITIIVSKYDAVLDLDKVVQEIVKQFPDVTATDLIGSTYFEGFDHISGLGLHRLTKIDTDETLFKVWLAKESG